MYVLSAGLGTRLPGKDTGQAATQTSLAPDMVVREDALELSFLALVAAVWY